MTRVLRILPRAERDAQSIFEWLAGRSSNGAVRWWAAFESAAHELVLNPLSHALAPEDELVEAYEIRQFLFKTPRGRTYRGVFTVVGDEIRVLRVRGPGQPPLEPDEVAAFV